MMKVAPFYKIVNTLVKDSKTFRKTLTNKLFILKKYTKTYR